jgi:hypothetical protein
VTEEGGGTFGWGMFNCGLEAGMLRSAASLTGAVAGAEEEIESGVPGLKARAVRRPAGVVVGMAPSNAPVILGVRAVAAPLAFGNTVVLKASEKRPRVHAAVAGVGTDSNQSTLTDAEAGRRIGVSVTASNAVGTSAQSLSAATAVVGAPFATAKPTISGGLKPGRTLTATTGTWAENPTEFHYQWSSCDSVGKNCTPIGTDSNRVALTSADSGHRIKVVVTAVNANGSGQSSRITPVVS